MATKKAARKAEAKKKLDATMEAWAATWTAVFDGAIPKAREDLLTVEASIFYLGHTAVEEVTGDSLIVRAMSFLKKHAFMVGIVHNVRKYIDELNDSQETAESFLHGIKMMTGMLHSEDDEVDPVKRACWQITNRIRTLAGLRVTLHAAIDEYDALSKRMAASFFTGLVKLYQVRENALKYEELTNLINGMMVGLRKGTMKHSSVAQAHHLMTEYLQAYAEYSTCLDVLRDLTGSFPENLCPPARPDRSVTVHSQVTSLEKAYLDACRKDLELQELDLNAPDADWGRYREEFNFYKFLQDKPPSDEPTFKVITGRTSAVGSLMTDFANFVRAIPNELHTGSSIDVMLIPPKPSPLEWSNTASKTLFINLNRCAHDVTQRLDIIDKKRVCYNLVCPALSFHKDVDKPYFEAPKQTKRVILKLKGTREMRKRIASQFAVALKTKCTIIVVINFGCPSCKISPIQMGQLYAEALLLYAGKGVTTVYLPNEIMLAATKAPHTHNLSIDR